MGSIPSWAMSAVDLQDSLMTVFNFTQVTRAGNASIVGSGIPDSMPFNFTILPGPISADFSLVTNEQLRITAG